jgi:hypothetical protein
MKKQFLIILSLVMISVASVAAGEAPGTTSRSVNLEHAFTSIAVKGNVEVVMITADSKTLNVEASDRLINQVAIEVRNGVLHINGPKGSARNRVIVFVPVNELEKVILRGNSHLTSRGRIESKKLQIRIEGYSTVNVTNIGEIEIESDDKYQFNYEKAERAIVRGDK